MRVDLGLVGHLVTRVSFDRAVSLLTDGDAEVRIESGLRLTLQDGPTADITPEDVAAHAGPLVDLLHRTVTRSEADEGGTLVLDLDGSVLVVRPDADHEAWTCARADGGTVVCRPGGELAIWGRHAS